MNQQNAFKCQTATRKSTYHITYLSRGSRMGDGKFLIEAHASREPAILWSDHILDTMNVSYDEREVKRANRSSSLTQLRLFQAQETIAPGSSPNWTNSTSSLGEFNF